MPEPTHRIAKHQTEQSVVLLWAPSCPSGRDNPEYTFAFNFQSVWTRVGFLGALGYHIREERRVSYFAVHFSSAPTFVHTSTGTSLLDFLLPNSSMCFSFLHLFFFFSVFPSPLQLEVIEAKIVPQWNIVDSRSSIPTLKSIIIRPLEGSTSCTYNFSPFLTKRVFFF